MIHEPLTINIVLTGEPMLFYCGTDGMAYRVDLGELPTSPREVALFEALRDVSEPVNPNQSGGHPRL